MVKRYKEPELFGGQGVSAPPRLCIDCFWRPIEYGRRPRPEGTPACMALSGENGMDPLKARDLCRGDLWAPPSNAGARDC